MPKVTLYNTAGAAAGEIELNDSVFGVEYNEAVIHQAVVRQMANERLGTHATKTRGLVRGGGTVFGPTPRSHAKDMTRKARQLAVKSALSEKLRANELIVVDAINFDAPKTKEVVKFLAAFNVDGKALIVDGGTASENTVLSARNIPGVKAYAPSGLNIYDIVHYTKLFLTQDAVKKIEEVLA